jgi:hypothetical protein
MDEYCIEEPIQADIAHISLDMLTFWVQLLTDFQHLERKIDQGELEMSFEMGGIVPAAASQLEQSLW